MRKDMIPAHVGLLLAAVLGAGLVAYSTSSGVGVGGDATIYIYSAKNLLAGHGLGLVGPQGEFRLLPYFPPGFPLALAAVGSSGIDLDLAGRWLNILLFAGIIVLSGEMLLRVVRPIGLVILIACVLALSPLLSPVYSWVMSEPLCIFLGFLGIVLELAFLRHGDKGLALLVCAALAAGLSFLTRYSAAAFPAAGLIGLLWLSRRPRRERVRDGIVYAVAAAAPMAAWLAVDLTQTATVSSRRFESVERMVSQFFGAWGYLKDGFLNWLVPNSWVTAPPYPHILNSALAAVTLAGVLAWTVWAARTASKHEAQDNRAGEAYRLIILLGLFIVAYVGLVVVVYALTFPTIDINNRMLSPVHVAFLWLVTALAGLSLSRVPNRRWIGQMALAAFGLATLWYGWRDVRIVRQNQASGLGYNSADWRESDTIRAVKALPASTLIVTNEETAILYLLGRPTYSMQEPFQVSNAPAVTYGDGDLATDKGERVFRQDGAALVLFNSIQDQLAVYYGDQARARLAAMTQGLFRAFQGNDGAIYFYRPPAN
jgi:hypothetical protein